MGFGYWAIEEKVTGGYVGELGFADYKRDMEPSLHGSPELGWVLASRAHGRGYATEAASAVVAWAGANFGSNKLVCLIHPDNIQSLRVAAKCGFHESYRTTYKGHPTIVFARN